MTKHAEGTMEVVEDAAYHPLLTINQGCIAIVSGPADTNEQDAANAAEIARRWNCHEKLVAALEALQEIEPDDCDINSFGYCEAHGRQPCPHDAARDALASAKEGA